MDIRPITATLARTVAEDKHYLHRKPQVGAAFGLFVPEGLRGIVVFGTPASRHLQMGACPTDPSKVTELNRLWLDDELPANTASWFVSRALRRLPPMIVVSYADTTYDHMGYVYRALSFRYAGWTDMDRRTPRYDYLPADPTVHTRDAFRNGYETRVRRRPKVRYWTVTGSQTERRRLARLCGWPSYDWNLMPPPREHVHWKEPT